MDIDQLKARFPDENTCRKLSESIIWRDGRFCPRSRGIHRS
jgi:hypothetical protein